MITKKIIEKIEGEAELFFEQDNETVTHTAIAFEHFRGFESFLRGKNALDALVLTPRICGICGHSHLHATVRAIEDAYNNSGNAVELTDKARHTREITLCLEHVQNHLKWIYFVIIPELERLRGLEHERQQLKAAYAASLANKVIAIFAGQYPHSSYMLPGGITSDVTYMDITKALHTVDELVEFVQKEFLGTDAEQFLSFSSCKEMNALSSDLSFIESSLIELQMHKKGFGHDRFLVLGEHGFVNPAKIKKTIRQSANARYVSLAPAYSPHKKSFAKNALYKEEFIETGPLARAMANAHALIKNMHRRYRDSTYTRIMARIYETVHLLLHIRSLIGSLDLSQASFHKPSAVEKLTAKGVGIVEAPRGSLIHEVDIQNGKIEAYRIVTPTQFNLASGTKKQPSSAQNAMKGTTPAEAAFIFRSFDVCSVCTTH